MEDVPHPSRLAAWVRAAGVLALPADQQATWLDSLGAVAAWNVWDALARVEITPEPKVQLLISGSETEIQVPLGLMASGPVPLAEHVDDLLRHPNRRPSKLPTH